MTTDKKKGKKTNVADLKRQIIAFKLENSNLKLENSNLRQRDDAVELVSPLCDRWEQVPGEVESGMPIYTLDGDAGTISKIDQGNGQTLYEIEVGAKTAFFGDIVDAAEQGERWAGGYSRDAQHNPVSISQRYESAEELMPQADPRNMKSTGPANESLEALNFQDVPRRYSASKMEELAFMEEEVLILVHESTNPIDIPIPCFQNDGLSQYFIRGKEQSVKRKFLEQIARCKVTSYTQELYQDASGADTYRQVPHTTLAFGFEVIEDRSPKGRDWLRGIQQEGH